MIEDALNDLAEAGFVVSNVFQVGGDTGGPFGPPGWQVYLWNLHNTRSGSGTGGTLEAALRAAMFRAMQGPTYVRPPELVAIMGASTSGRSKPPPLLLLGDSTEPLGTPESQGDLF